MNVTSFSLATGLAIFAVSALVICWIGTRLTKVADQLADRSGIGEALIGGILMGAVTSMSGSVLSVTAAWNGHADLSVSNAIGGMAAQLAFLGVADVFYRKANLEHAAASSENLMQGAVLICLLSVILVTVYSPDVTIGHVHPGTLVLLGSYVYGFRLVHRGRNRPMWKPTRTHDTREDRVESCNLKLSLPRLWFEFGILALVLAVGGWILQATAVQVSEKSGLSHAVVGALFTATTTSLPELVTSVAAVRRGALTLAVSGIIGGNAYDSLFLVFSDLAYLSGSIYHAISDRLLFWVAVNCLMTGILLLGLIFRERHGIGGIGFESFLMVLIYICSVVLLVVY